MPSQRRGATVLTLNQANLDGIGPLDDDRLRWLLEMASTDGQALVADDGEIAGFAMVFEPDTAYDSSNYRWFVERYDAFGYLDRIVVAPTHRRRGVGTLLDGEARAEDGARGPGRLVCEVYVEPPNVASLAFHEWLCRGRARAPGQRQDLRDARERVAVNADPAATARACADAMWAEDQASRQLGMEIVDVGPGTPR